MSKKNAIFCPHLALCNGCYFDKKPYVLQSQHKLEVLSNYLSKADLKSVPIQFKSSGENFLRHRFDFTIENNLMGLYNKNRELIDLHTCHQLTPELENFFIDFKKIPFPITKGSVRLRVGPSGQRGAWLDFANVDIKNLLAEKNTFQKLLELDIKIEIGQKGKSLVKVQDEFKLSDPSPFSWFQTKNTSLQCLISSFTQPSWVTADSLVDIIFNWLLPKPLKIAEFGSGIGQFTIPLLKAKHQVDAFESHPTAVDLLNINATSNTLESNLTIYSGDFQKQKIINPKQYDFALVNPPRSGLKNFVDELIRFNINNIIYVSCYPESLAIDLKRLTTSGYEIVEIVIVDQFPQTQHFETCVLLQRVNFNT